jgi:aconitate hydratase
VATLSPRKEATVHAKGPDGQVRTFHATIRVDTPEEVSYYRHGGILQYVLRQMLE